MMGMPPADGGFEFEGASRSARPFPPAPAPCLASKRLVGGYHMLAMVDSAVSTSCRATPSSPPINSTTTSASDPMANAQRIAGPASERQSPRALFRVAGSSRRQSRAGASSTAPPTRRSAPPSALTTPPPDRAKAGNRRFSMVGSLGVHHVQVAPCWCPWLRNFFTLRAAWRTRCSFSTNATPHIAFAIFAKADAWRYRHLGVDQQKLLGEFHRSQLRGIFPAPVPRRTSTLPAPGICQPALPPWSPPAHRGATCRWRGCLRPRLCGPFSAAAAATCTGVKAP